MGSLEIVHTAFKVSFLPMPIIHNFMCENFHKINQFLPNTYIALHKVAEESNFLLLEK